MAFLVLHGQRYTSLLEILLPELHPADLATRRTAVTSSLDLTTLSSDQACGKLRGTVMLPEHVERLRSPLVRPQSRLGVSNSLGLFSMDVECV